MYVNMGTQYAEAIYTPTIDLNYGEYYAGIWMGVPAINSELFDTEADIYAGWRHELSETFSVDLGATRYAYDNIGDDFLSRSNALEFYVGLATNLPFSPAFYVYRDIDNNCNTFEASGSHCVPILKKLDLNLGLALGYISNDTEDYCYYAASADFDYTIAESTSVTAGLRIGGSSDERIFGKGYDPDPRENAIWYGFGVKTGF
jgi:hypothetical protein